MGRVAVCRQFDLALGLEDLCIWMEGTLVWVGRRTCTGKENVKRSRCRRWTGQEMEFRAERRVKIAWMIDKADEILRVTSMGVSGNEYLMYYRSI